MREYGDIRGEQDRIEHIPIGGGDQSQAEEADEQQERLMQLSSERAKVQVKLPDSL